MRESALDDESSRAFYISDGTMNALLEKYNDYLRLVGCKAEYELENGTILKVEYKKENFPHLIGLHKLKDIQLIQFWNDRSNRTVKLRDILKSIEKEKLTDSKVKASVFYKDIEQRYESFSYDNLTTLNYTDAIINFNSVSIKSKLKSDYLLFEERPTAGEYNHLGIAMDSIAGTRYFETFFHESTDKYILGQTVVKIKAFRIVNPEGKIILEDCF